MEKENLTETKQIEIYVVGENNSGKTVISELVADLLRKEGFDVSWVKPKDAPEITSELAQLEKIDYVKRHTIVRTHSFNGGKSPYNIRQFWCDL